MSQRELAKRLEVSRWTIQQVNEYGLDRNCSLVAEHRGLTDCLSNSDESAAMKYFHRSMLAQGVYQVDSASEGIKSSWVKAEPCLQGSGPPGQRRDDLPEQAAAVMDL